MEEREIFGNLSIVPPIFVRLDGRSFHRLARRLRLERPFDERFSRAMAGVSSQILSESGLAPLFAFTFSDEISLYFPGLPFRGRVEKIDSVLASFAASCLTLALAADRPLAFDARVIVASPEYAVEYLCGRQQEAWRNHLNAYCQEALGREGIPPGEVAARLSGMRSEELHEFMFSRGVNLAKTPAWQRRGILVYRKEEERKGFDPRAGEPVETVRRVITMDRDLPVFSSPEGRAFLEGILGGP
ncbi:MAG: tRNA 5'-guanylyltransferase [Methanomicrobiales archaeon]|nr:tRNA 5'-guanylyltransferase [Methanomicrobiales archaeon]MDD1669441.1 tRNA 5'-guanylyltransferase [Methanomicrobiales archaeon]